MKASERRKIISEILINSDKPITGSELAERMGVSRQIIVQDVALLKASGHSILSTHNGYVIQNSPMAERAFKLYHTSEQTEDELNTIVGLGGTVVDVFVWHKVYGKMSAPLNIYSKYHVGKFLNGVRSGKSAELMNITQGFHYHTVRAETPEILDEIENVLTAKGYIVPDEE